MKVSLEVALWIRELKKPGSKASLWLCLYALLEGKAQYFYLMLVMLVVSPILAIRTGNLK